MAIGYVFLLIQFIYPLRFIYFDIMETIPESNYETAQNFTPKAHKEKSTLIKRSKQIMTINRFVDYMLNAKVPIEIKTCQVTIKTGQANFPERAGRFTLSEKEHEELINHLGYYLFIVKNEGRIYAWKMLEASSISYRRFVQWNKIIERS